MDGPIEGFGSDLNVPNEVPAATYQYAVSLNLNGMSDWKSFCSYR